MTKLIQHSCTSRFLYFVFALGNFVVGSRIRLSRTFDPEDIFFFFNGTVPRYLKRSPNIGWIFLDPEYIAALEIAAVLKEIPDTQSLVNSNTFLDEFN